MTWTSQRKKLMLQRDDNMIAYMEDTLKSNVGVFEHQGKHPKLFTICSIVNKQSRTQLEMKFCHVLARIHPTADGRATLTVLPTAGGRFCPTIASRSLGFGLTLFLQLFNKGFIGFPLECGSYKSSIEILQEGGDLGKDLDPIQQSKEDSYQSGIRASSNRRSN
ncbi:hypothetical protein M9H77_18883 [Catharanthus roseus]|uniref:Uncharacterized protein n=1 Tax=Catharanthus roseus TaxID=4058 RepID=A0ACC0B8P8_CATRO|nr:hypothetical protein M9H77_18883 [Catharanthus roseus]